MKVLLCKLNIKEYGQYPQVNEQGRRVLLVAMKITMDRLMNENFYDKQVVVNNYKPKDGPLDAIQKICHLNYPYFIEIQGRYVPLNCLDCIHISLKLNENLNKSIMDPIIYSGFQKMMIDVNA